jgi:predicted  nucleic acid-binding Zn-ribbon protein
MFNFETLVMVLVLSGTSVVASAQTPQFGTDCTKWADLGYKSLHETPPDKDRAAYYDGMAQKCTDGQSKAGATCDNAPDNYTKALQDFSGACGEANLGGECADELAKCVKTNDKDKDPDAERSSRRTTTKRDANQPYDVDGVKKQCPAMAGKDLDKLKKELADQREKVKKLEKELPDIEDKANKAQSATNEKLQQIKTDMADKQKKLSEDLQKLSDEKDGAEKQITDQVTGITQQIAKANDALGQVSITKMDGQLKLKQTKTQADLNCHASASAQVAKMQTDTLEAMKTGTYNGGGFTTIMKNVGLTDRQHWQRIATKYYQWCLDSKPTMDTKDGANDGYKLLVAQANKSESSIREQIKQLQAQQQQLVGGVCGQPMPQANGTTGGESAVCQSARKASEKANQLQQGFATDRQTASDKYNQTAKQGQQEVQTLKNQYTQRTTEVSEEKARLDNLQRYLEAKYEKSGGTSEVDGKGLSKALTSMSALDSASRKLVKCTKILAHSKDGYCTGDCETARAFLKTIKVSDNYDPAISDKGDPAPVPDGGSGIAVNPAHPGTVPPVTPPAAGGAGTGH